MLGGDLLFPSFPVSPQYCWEEIVALYLTPVNPLIHRNDESILSAAVPKGIHRIHDLIGPAAQVALRMARRGAAGPSAGPQFQEEVGKWRRWKAGSRPPGEPQQGWQRAKADPRKLGQAQVVVQVLAGGVA